MIHSYNVGTTLNKLTQYSNNFVYTFALSNKSLLYNPCILQENIKGISFLDWLQSDAFNMTEYYSIILQISLSLNTAYRQFGFIHNDLYPWI